MGPDKRSPRGSSRSGRIESILQQHPPDRIARNLMSEIVKCSLDPRIAPPWILARHPENELLNLSGDRRPTWSALLAAIVLSRDELSVPAKQRVRRDHRRDLREHRLAGCVGHR